MKALALVVMGGVLLAVLVPAASTQAGDRAQVEQMQRALKQQGHDPGPIDGVMGAQTRDALRAYQKKHGLKVTGQLDDETVAKLGGQSSQTDSSGTNQTGGAGRKPNAVDPAQASKTGANVGEGASYSRSTEKGGSTMKGASEEKK